MGTDHDVQFREPLTPENALEHLLATARPSAPVDYAMKHPVDPDTALLLMRERISRRA